MKWGKHTYLAYIPGQGERKWDNESQAKFCVQTEFIETEQDVIIAISIRLNEREITNMDLLRYKNGNFTYSNYHLHRLKSTAQNLRGSVIFLVQSTWERGTFYSRRPKPGEDLHVTVTGMRFTYLYSPMLQKGLKGMQDKIVLSQTGMKDRSRAEPGLS